MLLFKIDFDHQRFARLLKRKQLSRYLMQIKLYSNLFLPSQARVGRPFSPWISQTRLELDRAFR